MEIEIDRDAKQGGWLIYVDGNTFLILDNYTEALALLRKQLKYLGLAL